MGLPAGAPAGGDGPVRVPPLARRHTLDGIALVPDGVTAGWVQVDGTRTFALGFFLPDGRFLQVALADGKGRVYATGSPRADLDAMEPVLVLRNDGTWRW
ncbi:MAG: hypothetical protein UHD09_02215, partial [Bifidobacterium sp.]|nr:hypothetical protein [Bifidobacterium sp.]